MKSKSIYPICVSLSEPLPSKAIGLAKKFPFVEIRLDAGCYSVRDLRSVIKATESCIITCRPNQQYYSELERQSLLLQAIALKADFIDIEVESEPKFKKKAISLAKQKKVKVILSLHDFKATPSATKLDQEIKAAQKLGADVVKVATFVKNQKDIQILLNLLNKYKNLVVIGMGQKGQALRIAAPVLGGLFTFAAAAAGKETAPGQIAYKEIKKIYKELGLFRSNK